LTPINKLAAGNFSGAMSSSTPSFHGRQGGPVSVNCGSSSTLKAAPDLGSPTVKHAMIIRQAVIETDWDPVATITGAWSQ
jgi:hypothetical protein